MKLLLLSLFTTLALGVTFNTHASCSSWNAGCTGNAGDNGLTCLGQDAVVVAGMSAQGYDITTMTTFTQTEYNFLVRWAYQINQAVTGEMSVHADYEPILRCTAEANGLDYGQITSCYDLFAGCMNEAACVAAWDVAANASIATLGMAFTYVSGGFQAIGDIPFTFVQDGTDPLNVVPMDALSLGYLNGFLEMQGNGKATAMMSCMLKDWAATDIQVAYPLNECYWVTNACANDADCVAASVEFKDCAKDDHDIDISVAAPFWNNLYGVVPTTATHDDWCSLAACTGEIGNTLYMSMATCAMNTAGFAYKKCYDDMMDAIEAYVFMLLIIVGGVAFVGSLLIFTTSWCLCCRGKANKVESEV